MEGCQAEVHWHPETDPYAPHTKWVWEKIAQPESPNDNRQAVWWSDMVVALVIKATLRNLPVNPATSAQVLAAAQLLRTAAGAGTLDLMLHNANHGVLILADTVLSQPWVQVQCEHLKS